MILFTPTVICFNKATTTCFKKEHEYVFLYVFVEKKHTHIQYAKVNSLYLAVNQNKVCNEFEFISR